MQNLKLLVSLLLTIFSARNTCSADGTATGGSPINLPSDRDGGRTLIEFIKNETAKYRGVSFGHWLPKITRLETAKRKGDAIEASFLIAPTLCVVTGQVPLGSLYSGKCPVQNGTYWRKCTGSFRMEASLASISCGSPLPAGEEDPEVINSVKGEKSTIKLMDNVNVVHAEGMEVDAVVKDHIYHSHFFIEDWYVRLIKLEQSRRTSNGLFVKFTLAPSLCEQTNNISLEQLYSSSCPIIQDEEQMLCSGMILNRTAADYRITCRIVVRTTLYEPDRPTPIVRNTTTSTITHVFSSIEKTQITIVLKRLMLTEVMQIKGLHVRIVRLDALAREETGTYVQFTVAPSTCRTMLKITLEQLYSNSCPVDTDASALTCNGTVQLTDAGIHNIQCAHRLMTTQAIKIGMVEVTEELTIKTSIKQLIITEGIKVDGRIAHLEKLLKHKNIGNGIEVEFTVTDSSDPSSESAFETVQSETSTHLAYTKKLICKGILSLVPGGKDNVECEERKDDIPSTDPSKPSDGSITTTTVQSEYTVVVRKVERLVFIEKMTINGYYVRVDKLTKHEIAANGIDTEFTLVRTTCAIKVKVTIDQLYSTMCTPESSSDPIVCRGVLPTYRTLAHQIKCLLPDGKEMPLAPAPSGPMEDEGIETSEMAEITTRIKETMISKNFSIRGHHAQFHTLITHKEVNSGIEVEFTIIETACDVREQRTVEELYDPSCLIQHDGKRLICKGIIFNIPGLDDNVQCSERDDVEEFDPSKQPTPGIDPTTLKHEEITISVRKLMYSNSMTVKGQHVRVGSLTRIEKVASGAYVEFTIVQTNCNGRLSLTLEQLYSDRCTPLRNADLVRCKGLLPLVHGISHTIRCSDGDKLTERGSSRPSPSSAGDDERLPDKSQALSHVKLLTFVERFTIERKYVRVHSVTKAASSSGGMEVEFTIAATNCDITLKISLEQLYSRLCASEEPSVVQICKGFLPSNTLKGHIIKCADPKGEKEGAKPTKPSTGEATAPEAQENEQITTAIRLLIVTQNITVGRRQASFKKLIRHSKTESGVEVVFTVIGSSCDSGTEVPGAGGPEFCPSPGYARQLICTAILSLLPGVKDSVTCNEPQGNVEESDPSQPSSPGSKHDDPLIIEEITTSIKMFIFTEVMTIKGRHARVEQLIKYERVTTGINVEFSIYETACDGSLKIALEELYSSVCGRVDTRTTVICRGILPYRRSARHSISCSDGDKLTSVVDPLKQSTRDVQSSEYSKAVRKVERLVFIEKMAVNGYYARVDKLTKYENTTHGAEVIFAIRSTSCTIKEMVTIDQVYSSKCVTESVTESVICKGLLEYEQISHQVHCYFPDGTEKPLAPQNPGELDPEVHAASDVLEITTKVKEVIMGKKISVNGQYARLDTLISHKKVDSGIEVEFTVMETTCDINVELTVEQLYGLSCIRHGTGRRLVCKGLVFTAPGTDDNVQCSERDDIEEYDPSKPDAPGSGDIIDPSTVSPEKVIISIKKLMYTETMTINGHHIQVEKLLSHERTSSGVLVEFTIVETTCSGHVSVQLEEIYSSQCVRVDTTEIVICKGLIPFNNDKKHTIRCSGGDKLTGELGPSQPSAPGQDGISDQSSISPEVIKISIKELMFTETMTINGHHVRVKDLTNYQKDTSGANVEFTIVQTTCSGRLKITLEAIYSHYCAEVLSSSVVVCRGLLPLQRGSRHTIRCSGGDKLTEKTDPLQPRPGLTRPSEASEREKITISIKELIVSEKITVDGRDARFESLISHKKSESAVEVVFIVTDPVSNNKQGESLGITRPEAYARLGYTKKLICKGILSLVEGVKSRVKCEEPKDYINQIDPSRPFTPSDPRADVTAIEILTKSVEELLFIEAMTINGRHARVDQLIKFQKVTTGVHVKFSVFETTCEGSSKILFAQLYSTMCSRVEAATVVICEGTLALEIGSKHTVRCNGGDKLTSEADPSAPSNGDNSAAGVQNLERSTVLRKVERLVFIEKMAIDGYYVRVEKLTKYEQVTGGIDIMFTVKRTTCPSRVTVTFDQLYSSNYEIQRNADPIICSGMMPFKKTFTHKIKCFFANGTEMLLGASTTGVGVVEPAEVAQVTVQIKRLLITRRLTVNGQHARLDTLIAHRRVKDGIEVEFTITDTTCNGNLQLTVEQLYSQSCARRNYYTKKLICRGVISIVTGKEDDVECSEQDDIEQVDPSRPSAPGSTGIASTIVNTEEVILSIKRLMYAETMTIKGHHVRFEKLTKSHKVSSGVYVEFTISETICNGRLKITLETIYSHRCNAGRKATVVQCKGVIPLLQGAKHSIRCSGGDKLTEGYDPQSTLPGAIEPGEKIYNPEVMSKLKLLVFVEKFNIHGRHARIHSITKADDVVGGTEVSFTITATVCDIKLKISLRQLYQRFCPPLSPLVQQICEGILPSNALATHSIRCVDIKDPGEPLKPTHPAPDQSTISESTELKEIAVSVQRLIVAEGITVNGRQPRFETLITHTKTDSGVEVVFTVVGPRQGSLDENPFGPLQPADQGATLYTEQLICTAILSSVPGVNDSVNCEELGDEKSDPSKPAAPSGEQAADPSEVDTEEVTIFVQKVMFSETMTINGHHVRIEKLTRAQKVPTGVFVEFTILETTCSGRLRLTLETIYSKRCGAGQRSTVFQCNGIVSLQENVRHTIRCSGGDKLTEGYDPRPSIPSGTESAESIDRPEVLSVLKILAFAEKFRIHGHHARVSSLTSADKVAGGTQVVFTIAATVCDFELKVTLKQLYGGFCPLQKPSLRETCRGLLPPNSVRGHSISCANSEGKHEPNKPSSPAPGQSKPAETVQIAAVTASIERLIVSQGIAINGRQPRFDTLITHTKTETAIEVVFTVADPRYEDPGEVSSGMVRPGASTTLIYTKKLICKGVLSLAPGVKDEVECGELKENDEQVDPSLPSSPSAPGIDDNPSMDVQSPEYSKILRKVERLVFIEKMTVNGYHVRVDKITKLEKVTNGIDLTFVIIPTTSASGVVVTIDELYSSKYTLQSSSHALICKGILPSDREFDHQIKCFFPNGTETPLAPQPSDPGSSSAVESAEIAQVISQIKQMMFAKHLTINGRHAQLDTLITHKKIYVGTQVEFIITETTCDSSVQVTMDQLYGLSCVRHGYGKKLICKGIITNAPGLSDNIECSERDDVDEFDPSQSSTPVNDVMIDLTTVSSEKVTVSVRKVMFSETMTIKGHHVRVENLTSIQKVISGVLVEFTISETTCSSRLKLTLEAIYSHQCSVVQSIEVITCKGLLPIRQGITHTIRCSGGDKLTQRYPDGFVRPSGAPAVVTKENIYSLLKKVLFEKSMHLNGRYARLVSLDKVERSNKNELVVSFTIAPSLCEAKRQITLLELYTSTCPVNDGCLWLTCEGVLPSSPNAEYSFRCSAVVMFNGPQLH